jgi:hypothetical protein
MIKVSKEYKTPEELRDAIRIYFTQCQKSDTFPDYAGMKVFLKIKERDVTKMCENPDYADVFEDAMYMRESYLARRVSADNRMASGCMNLLKQPINGGYSEKSSDKKDGKLTIVLDGVGGERACK